MLKISSLFGRSPFAPIQSHMESVSMCVQRLPEIVAAIETQDHTRLDCLAEEISRLENDADLIQHDIRNHLPKSLFLPIDRNNLLEILTIQDKIADKVEDVAVLASLKPLELLPIFKEEFKLFVQKNIETFRSAKMIILELHDLIGSSFGGIEAEKVSSFVDEVAFHEHEVDLLQRHLLKSFFKAENQLNFITFHQWQKLFESIGSISNLSEHLAFRIRMTLALK